MGSDGFGIWTITQAGRQWLREHGLDKTALQQLLRETAPRAKRPASSSNLETKGASSPDPKPETGSRCADKAQSSQQQETTASILIRTNGNVPIHDVVDRLVHEIHQFTIGRANSRPSDDVLCDWVYLCYTLTLYSVGREVFDLIDPQRVNPVFYERARKLARACRLAGERYRND
jgi:hypothetical protein